MATTKTTKIVEAISLLSDVLSTEVAEASHFLEDEDDTVSSDDYEELKEAATSFVTDQVDVLETVKYEIEDEIGPTPWPDAGWEIEDDDDDVGNGTVIVEGDSDESSKEEAETPAEPTDEEKVSVLTTANEELTDQIAELEAEKEGLTQTLRSALDSVDELIDSASLHQTQMEID